MKLCPYCDAELVHQSDDVWACIQCGPDSRQGIVVMDDPDDPADIPAWNAQLRNLGVNPDVGDGVVGGIHPEGD